MKRILLAFLSTLIFASYGQGNRFDVGFEGGLGAASLRGNKFIDDHHNMRIGYSASFFTQYNFSKVISIRTGAYYERKGSSLEIPVSDVSGQPYESIKGKEHFDLLSVPIIVRASFGKKLRYFVNAGAYYGFLLRQTEYIEAFKSIPETKTDRTDYFKKNELGILAGVGISYTLEVPMTISVEFRNNLGLTNTSAMPVYGGGSIKTNSFNVLVGISYQLGQRSEAK